MVRIREIREDDVAGVIAVYRAVYGDEFPFQEFYDAAWVKKGVFNDDIIWVVGEHEDGRILGSAAVLLDSADHGDLVGEFGRLVVHPEARGLDLGAKLVAGLIERAEPAIDFGYAECRTVHTGAQKILTRQGFEVAGFEPHEYRFADRRESVVFVARQFGNARRLRRNNPRVIPEVYAIGSLALVNCGLDVDLIVEAGVEPYPVTDDADLELTKLDDTQLYRLLRLERKRVDEALVFGAMRLEYGYLRLRARDARYLALRRGPTLVGGLGYTWDELDRNVRIFELMATDDRARGTLLERAVAWLEATHAPDYLAIDVSAHAPRIQATLSLLGFVPVAYAPSMVYEAGERLDVVKMAKLRVPHDVEGLDLLPASAEAVRRVVETMTENARAVAVEAIARRVGIFEGLTDVQYARLRAICREETHETGTPVVVAGAADRSLFIVLAGGGEPVATIGPGEVFGELALIDALPRSATAVCRQRTRLVRIAADDFHALTQRDPRLGLVIHRNLARAIAGRLREAGLRLEAGAERLRGVPAAGGAGATGA